MAQLVGYHQYSYGNLATIPLSSLGPLGWSLLDQATAAGIPFMAGEGLKEVTIDFDRSGSGWTSLPMGTAHESS